MTTPGVRLRPKPLWKALRNVLVRYGASFGRDHGLWAGAVETSIWEEGTIVKRAVSVLEAAASQVLTPRLVQEILGITPSERARWAKDGRLPQSGSSFIKSSQLVSIPSYAPAVIADLLDRPEIIAEWRASDAKSTHSVR